MHFSESMNDHIWFQRLAIEQAELAWRLGEVPVGAIVVDPNGDVVSRAHNLKETTHNPCGHAEILAIQEAAQKLGSWRLNDCRIYVTLEPCTMCLAAIAHARIQQVVFGAYDPKGGAISLGYALHKDSRLNHRFSMMGGVLHFDCSRMLSEFFKQRRPTHGAATHNS
jgi:tRNA(adenine34) deaminase